MRIAVAQLDFTIGAFDANLERIAAAADEAGRRGADLLVLSELATTGYPPGDLLERADFVDRSLEMLDRVATLSDDELAILVGFVDRNPEPTGKALINAAALCHRGWVVGRTQKALLPTYDVFDEARYFEAAGAITPLELNGVRLGVTICEDVWTDVEVGSRHLYRRDPTQELVDAGADVLINLSASPFTLGKAEQRREMIRRLAAEHGRHLFYANQVGGHDELVFDGHSLVVDPTGRVVERARDFAEDLLVHEVALPAPSGAAVAGTPGELRDVSGSVEEEAHRALVLGLGDYASKTGFERVVLGLSGGIDSAVTACLAAAAVGPDNVLGVAMPTRHSSEGSVRDAESLAVNLGISFRVIAIDDVYQAFLDALGPVLAGADPDLTEENIQARVRGTVLMGISNRQGRLLLATGNKSELAVGYCTLYGDMAGGLAVIGDVPKTMVYRLARWINREREIIPSSTLTKAPSAELRDDQTDQDSLPPYELLDRVLEAYVEELRPVEEIVAAGLDEEAVRLVVRLIDGAEFKRRQAAPAIKITSKAFGMGRRMPIVADYPSLHGEA